MSRIRFAVWKTVAARPIAPATIPNASAAIFGESMSRGGLGCVESKNKAVQPLQNAGIIFFFVVVTYPSRIESTMQATLSFSQPIIKPAVPPAALANAPASSSAPLPTLELATIPILELEPTTDTMHEETSYIRHTIPLPGCYPTERPPPLKNP